MFHKPVYNKLLNDYVTAVLHWDEHPISGSAKRDVNIAKTALDVYIEDHVGEQYVSVINDMEPTLSRLI